MQMLPELCSISIVLKKNVQMSVTYYILAYTKYYNIITDIT